MKKEQHHIFTLNIPDFLNVLGFPENHHTHNQFKIWVNQISGFEINLSHDQAKDFLENLSREIEKYEKAEGTE